MIYGSWNQRLRRIFLKHDEVQNSPNSPTRKQSSPQQATPLPTMFPSCEPSHGHGTLRLRSVKSKALYTQNMRGSGCSSGEGAPMRTAPRGRPRETDVQMHTGPRDGHSWLRLRANKSAAPTV